MYPPRRHRMERSPTRQPTDWTTRRHIHPMPATAAELDDQLRLMVPHHPQCRWNTSPIRRPGEPLARTEASRCSCTAIPDRQHLTAVLRAAAAGQLPAEVTR